MQMLIPIHSVANSYAPHVRFSAAVGAKSSFHSSLPFTLSGSSVCAPPHLSLIPHLSVSLWLICQYAERLLNGCTICTSITVPCLASFTLIRSARPTSRTVHCSTTSRRG